MSSRVKIVSTLAAMIVALGSMAMAQTRVTVTIHATQAGAKIPNDFAGLSFETAAILPNSDGQHMFRATNRPLIHLFRTLGIRNLRIGGNTADRPSVKIPGDADIDDLFTFANASGAKVIYTLRMRESKPDDAVPIAWYLAKHYAKDIDCLAIGNEPNVYEKEYPAYRDEWKKFETAITAAGAAPKMKFCGPSTTPNKAGWASDFARDFAGTGRLRYITQHSYPGGNGKLAEAEVARDKMLSPGLVASYEKMYETFVPAVRAEGLQYRIEETNNFYNGGAEGASNTFASALWGLDYLFWWAEQGALGVNFHTGDNVAAGEQQRTCWYAVFWTTPDGYAVHPLGYAMKAFDVASHGAILPAVISAEGTGPNMTAYAVKGNDGRVYVTLINKEHGTTASEVAVTLDAGRQYSDVATMALTAPKDDITATSGITLGGAEISEAGNWSGAWTSWHASARKNVQVKVPAGSVLIVRLGGH